MQFKDDRRNRQLIKSLVEGDKIAFDELFHAFEPKLYAYAMKLTHNPDDAGDVIQEVFLKIWERRKKIDPKNNFDSLLYKIAKNLIYNKARHRAYEFAYKEYAILFANQKEHITENMVNFNELDTFIKDSYCKLPPVQKEVFMLSRIEGLSNDEIAKKLKTSTSNIKNHINKALLFLKKQIRAHEMVPLFLLFLYFFS